MSALRLARNPDGTSHVLVQEPASAHLTGNGGANVGYMLPSKVTPILRTNAEIRNEARRRVREAGRP